MKQGCFAPFFNAWSNKVLNFIRKLFENKHDNSDIVNYVRTEWGNETKHLSNADCIGFYDNYLTSKGRIKQ